jgi:nicotinate-nucleotide pyrophosphorylase (carboxylating)
MRHPALEQSAFAPLTAQQAQRFSPIVSAALAEDGAARDLTSGATVGEGLAAAADVALRAPAVVAGLEIAALAFRLVDGRTRFESLTSDGVASAPAAIGRVEGAARSLLGAERVALNFLARLSGIATLTRSYVERVSDLPVRICDTRKTTPGLRELERYAVRAGGGYNHRFNLSDAVLIKDNHLRAAGSVAAAIGRTKAAVSPGTIVEIECENLGQVEEALRCGVDAILLDNMDLPRLRAAVAMARGKAVLEASGGITLGNVRDVALTGVEVISVGALTHSAPAADLALDLRVELAAAADSRE